MISKRSREAKTQKQNWSWEDEDGRVTNERRFGGAVECSRGWWNDFKPDFSNTFLIRVIPGIFLTRLMHSNNSGNFRDVR